MPEAGLGWEPLFKRTRCVTRDRWRAWLWEEELPHLQETQSMPRHSTWCDISSGYEIWGRFSSPILHSQECRLVESFTAPQPCFFWNGSFHPLMLSPHSLPLPPTSSRVPLPRVALELPKCCCPWLQPAQGLWGVIGPFCLSQPECPGPSASWWDTLGSSIFKQPGRDLHPPYLLPDAMAMSLGIHGATDTFHKLYVTYCWQCCVRQRGVPSALHHQLPICQWHPWWLLRCSGAVSSLGELCLWPWCLFWGELLAVVHWQGSCSRTLPEDLTLSHNKSSLLWAGRSHPKHHILFLEEKLPSLGKPTSQEFLLSLRGLRVT